MQTLHINACGQCFDIQAQVKVLEESLQNASGDLEDSRAKRKESANHLKTEKVFTHNKVYIQYTYPLVKAIDIAYQITLHS